MQYDHLEQFILGQRASFDDAEPGLKIWGEISQELDRRKRHKIKLWRVVGIAASVLVLLACGALIGGYYTQQQYAADPLQKVAPQYAKLQQQYEEEIDTKYQKLVNYQQAQVVEPDLEQLDEVMAELRQELLVAPRGKEMEIVESLLKSYQAKVEILERVLDRIQTTSPEGEKDSNDDEVTI